VQVIAMATRWTTVELGEALSRRCDGQPSDYHAGIEIVTLDQPGEAPAKTQSAVHIAQQLGAGVDRA
jgi:hypothetical protein